MHFGAKWTNEKKNDGGRNLPRFEVKSGSNEGNPMLQGGILYENMYMYPGDVVMRVICDMGMTIEHFDGVAPAKKWSTMRKH